MLGAVISSVQTEQISVLLRWSMVTTMRSDMQVDPTAITDSDCHVTHNYRDDATLSYLPCISSLWFDMQVDPTAITDSDCIAIRLAIKQLAFRASECVSRENACITMSQLSEIEQVTGTPHNTDYPPTRWP